MSAIRVAVTAIGVVLRVARSPKIRAGLRAVPRLIPTSAKLAAFEAAKAGAFSAGAGLRRVLPNSITPHQQNGPRNDA